jgi:predicted nucleic acid-binding protein
VARRPSSFVVDTDIFIDYLNGFERMREILDSPLHRVYYAAITRKELLGNPGLSSTERRRIEVLLLKHRLIRVDEIIAENFSTLLQKYRRQGLRNGDALVAATARSRNLPLFTRNVKHYRFIAEITLIDPRWKQ